MTLLHASKRGRKTLREQLLIWMLQSPAPKQHLALPEVTSKSPSPLCQGKHEVWKGWGKRLFQCKGPELVRDGVEEEE